MLKNSKNLAAYDYGGACAFYLGAIIVSLLCQAAAGIISAAFARYFPDISKNGDFNTAFMIFIQIANGAFIYFFTKSRRRKFDFTFVRRDGDGKGITPSVIIVPVIAAVALMAGMYLPTVWFGYFTELIGVPKSAGNIDLDTVSSIIMIFIASVALAPLMEETIYRGVLLHGLRREKSVITSVMLTALAFSLMHMNIVQVVFQFALGVLSGFIAIKAKRLLPSVILHASANTLALLMQITPFAGVLVSCEAWLTQNITAAFFITLGLFAVGFGALFVLVRYGFEIKQAFAKLFAKKSYADMYAEKAKETEENAEKKENADGTTSEENADDETAKRVAEVRRVSGRSDGTFKYFIGLGICAIMLVVNLVTVILT